MMTVRMMMMRARRAMMMRVMMAMRAMRLAMRLAGLTRAVRMGGVCIRRTIRIIMAITAMHRSDLLRGRATL